MCIALIARLRITLVTLCECETNNDGSPKYYGKDCSMNEEEMTSSMTSRETLCTALRDNMLIQDLTEDVVSGRASSEGHLPRHKSH